MATHGTNCDELAHYLSTTAGTITTAAPTATTPAPTAATNCHATSRLHLLPPQRLLCLSAECTPHAPTATMPTENAHMTAAPSPFETLPDELVEMVLGFVGDRWLITTVRHVCQRWRKLCATLRVSVRFKHNSCETGISLPQNYRRKRSGLHGSKESRPTFQTSAPSRVFVHWAKTTTERVFSSCAQSYGNATPTFWLTQHSAPSTR